MRALNTAIVAVIIFSSIANAQETYNLRGNGAKAGMSYSETLIMKFKLNVKEGSQSSGGIGFGTFKTHISVVSVDPGGDIVEATMQQSGETIFGESSQKLPSAKLAGKTLLCKKEDGKWKISLLDGTEDEEIRKDLEGLPGPSLQREFFPLVSVPIGHKWQIDAKDYVSVLAYSNPEIAAMVKAINGQANYIFNKVEKVDGVMCAFIKSIFTFKGNINVGEDSQKSIVKASIKCNSYEIRRLDTGLCIKQEVTFEIKSSGEGMSANGSGEGVVTRNP